MPSLYIITGSNGAGKSSIGRFFLPEVFQHAPVFDGDKLFLDKRGELIRSGIRSFKEARNLASNFVNETFDQLVEEALTENRDFLYEGHFTNEATWTIPRRFKDRGYIINLIFLGLSSLELSEARVIERANAGGHYVDPMTLAGNYYGNMEKLNKHFSWFDEVQIIDTSQPSPVSIALLQKAKVMESIERNFIPEWFITNMSDIAIKCL